MIIIVDNNIGKTYGGYKIESRSDCKTNDGHIIYNCKCIHCGIVKQMKLSSIKYRVSDKCTHFITIGEMKISYMNINNSIPDLRMRKIFWNIIRRCYDSNNKDYKFYGEKGIKICDNWLNNPSSFYSWAITNGYTKELTIDRIDENREYSPDNCRWVLLSDNSRFKSNTNYITATVTLSGRQWANLIPEHGINYINTMLREKGKDKTVKYIEDRFDDKHKNLNT